MLPLLDIIEGKSETYVVYEYFPNITLENHVNEKGKLTEDEVRMITKQVVEGYMEFKRHGIHHKNINPKSILLTQEKESIIKLYDFGITGLDFLTNKLY